MVRVEGGEPDIVHSVLIYSANGVLLKSIRHNGPGDIPVDMTEYQAGAYILALRYGNTKKSYKIVKQ